VDQLRHYLEDKGTDINVRAHIVGGAVRDHVMGIECHDQDVEVYGLSYGELVEWLNQAALDIPELHVRRIDTVGKIFGIVKVTTSMGTFDFSIPRRESKNAGVGHTAFDIEFDPDISENTAAARRDFTMNSMFMDSSGLIRDPYQGQDDIKHRILRATSRAYMEDPLRVLRGMQFASRFNLEMSANTVELSRLMRDGYFSLSDERIWEEWKKWALGEKPSMGLKVLSDTQWVSLYPELSMLIHLPQDPTWHPEGDVFIHTCHVVDAMAMLAKLHDEGERLTLMFAALLHDVGKAITTETVDGKIRSPGHAEVGTSLAEDFLSSIGAPRWLIEQVKPLVREHMVHVGTQQTPRVIRRLSLRLEPSNIKLLRLVVLADMMGRPPLPAEDCLKSWVELAETLRVTDSKPQRILMGRHLLNLGLPSGPLMGRILNDAYEAQLDGEFSNQEEALLWFSSRRERYLS
jgi:tRNA nucleotidyltransferase (CCA-adding enzyme)